MTHVLRTPALVSLNQLGFQFANGATLFEELNLTFDDQPTAIIGRKGVGKSVLARLIAGQLQPGTGSVARSVCLHYVAQTFVATPGKTVADATGTASALNALERLKLGCATADDFDLSTGSPGTTRSGPYRTSARTHATATRARHDPAPCRRQPSQRTKCQRFGLRAGGIESRRERHHGAGKSRPPGTQGRSGSACSRGIRERPAQRPRADQSAGERGAEQSAGVLADRRVLAMVTGRCAHHPP